MRSGVGLGVIWAAALLAGCGPIPRDPAGTLRRVEAGRVIRVGQVEGNPDARVDRLLARVEARTGARARVERGGLEPLLLKLEDGRLDLVLGARFAPDTPWADRVALGRALDRRDGTEARAAMRNGENGWIVLVNREARAVAAQAS